MRDASRRPKELITLPVGGMTCTACERRITKALTALPGVISATASTRKGSASLIVTSQAGRAAIEQAIIDLGYGLGRSPWLNGDPQVWRSAGVAAVFVAVVVWFVGVGDLTGRIGDLSTGGLLLVLALGLAAGVSTCMAMVGGIVLAISASAAGRSGARGTAAKGAAGPGSVAEGTTALGTTAVGTAARNSVWRTNLTFQAGRIAGFGLLGVALGALGRKAAMPQPVVVGLMVAVAVVMLLVGVRLTELSPRVAGWSPTIPAAVGDRLGLTGDAPARRAAGTMAAGAATFFLPCGFTQAVQLYAFSTGSPRAAGAIMATFAIGTAPALFAIAGAPTLFKGTRKVAMLRALGVVVIGFAVINVTSAMRLAGVDLTSGTGAAQTVSANVTLTPTDQTINSAQDGAGYHPGDTVIYTGRPTHWVMTSTAPFTCAASLSSQDLGFQKSLVAGRNVIELPALPAGSYSYSCSMGMYSGRILVIPAPAAAAS
jgi:sulfite exporter TauE/SafE/copper chaperone CopZ